MSPSPEAAVHDLRVTLTDRRDDFDRVEFDRIYAIAESSHRGQQRRSGDPHILHSVVVATYVAAWGLPLPCVYAALLHDVPQTGQDLAKFSHDVGRNVMELVAGVVASDGAADLSAMLGDTDATMRRFNEYVLTIKIADRLHNAQTWQYVPWPAARRKATETLNTLAPLAKELGLPAVGAELRSLSIALLAGQKNVAQFAAPIPPPALVANESMPRSKFANALYSASPAPRSRRRPRAIRRRVARRPGVRPVGPGARNPGLGTSLFGPRPSPRHRTWEISPRIQPSLERGVGSSRRGGPVSGGAPP